MSPTITSNQTITSLIAAAKEIPRGKTRERNRKSRNKQKEAQKVADRRPGEKGEEESKQITLEEAELDEMMRTPIRDESKSIRFEEIIFEDILNSPNIPLSTKVVLCKLRLSRETSSPNEKKISKDFLSKVESEQITDEASVMPGLETPENTTPVTVLHNRDQMVLNSASTEADITPIALAPLNLEDQFTAATNSSNLLEQVLNGHSEKDMVKIIKRIWKLGREHKLDEKDENIGKILMEQVDEFASKGDIQRDVVISALKEVEEIDGISAGQPDSQDDGNLDADGLARSMAA